MQPNDQPTLVSEVNEEGNTEIIQTSQESNYEVNVTQIDATAPLPPPTSNLKAFFAPRYKCTITNSDGISQEFFYKKLDPGSQLMSYGQPLGVDTNIEDLASQTKEIQDRFAKIRDDKDEEGNVTPNALVQMHALMREPGARAMFEIYEQKKKNVVMIAVISPEITEEIYDLLEYEVADKLYQAITGGVTTDIAVVEHFPRDSEGQEV